MSGNHAKFTGENPNISRKHPIDLKSLTGSIRGVSYTVSAAAIPMLLMAGWCV